MSDMIERVGRAMADAVALNYDHNREIFNLYARAAIEAMREPTKRMEVSILNCSRHRKSKVTHGRDCYQAMIETALQ